LDFGPGGEVERVSLDPGHAEDDVRLASLVEMYRNAIAHLESFHDPAVAPLKRELEMLLRFAGGVEGERATHD
jgi:hypothetical protein